MSALATNKNQVTFIYNSATSLGSQALPHVASMDIPVQAIDISKTPLGHTVWLEVSENLEVTLENLLDKDHPEAPDLKNASYTTDDWLKILQNNPDLLQRPVLIRGSKCMQVQTPTDVLQFA